MKDAALPDYMQEPIPASALPATGQESATECAAPAPKQRLQSLDALRGLDMLCILGLDALASILARTFPENTFLQLAREQFIHMDWTGLSLYDLVFPLFVFIAGVSMAFSLPRENSSASTRWKTLFHLYRRAIILIVLGFIVNGTLTWDMQEMRFASVLGLIGLSCAIGGTIIMAVRKTPLVAGVALLILAGVTWLQYHGGDFSPSGSINAYLDQKWLPGRLHDGTCDPEGLLCIGSAIALALLGYMTGTILRHRECTPMMRFGFVFLCGAALAGIAFVAGDHYPIIKRIWTGTFVLAAGGIGMLLLSLFYLIIDVWNLRAWSFPFRVIGMNALFAYILVETIDFGGLNSRIFSGVADIMGDQYTAIFLASSSIVLLWLILFGMYRKKIFIKA